MVCFLLMLNMAIWRLNYFLHLNPTRYEPDQKHPFLTYYPGR